MNKKIIAFVLVIILAGVAVCTYLFVPEAQKLVATYTEEDFIEDNIYSDMESLSDRLSEEILKGSGSFTVYLQDLDVGAINRVNEYLDGIFGSGATYQQVGAVGNTYKKVTISIKQSTNYYAMQAYLNQTPIPESDPKAGELYEAVKMILDSVITEGMSDYEKELAIHDYLVTHCKYSEDPVMPSGSDVYRAYGALVNQDAVCNGYAEALQLLFMCAGIKSEFVIGTAGGVDHAWNLVQLNGKWYHLDATWDDPLPDQGENTLHPFFNVTDDIMAQNHTWNTEDYPAAESMEENYYVKNNLYFYNFDEYVSPAYDHIVRNGCARYEAVIEDYVEKEEDMQFVFENSFRYNSVSWQTYKSGKYCVLVIEAE